ncbi:MAG: transcriptional regulator [Paenibacillus sp.]|nr:transcriptional regulator [Paenibacillus sp.]
MTQFNEIYAKWMEKQIAEAESPRRRERLKLGLSHSSSALLQQIWLPAIGNLEHLHAEYEVRDLNNNYRYLDFAFIPGHSKGCIEVQDFRSHARDIEAGRFKDLCMKQALLTLEGWSFLPIAYLSIKEDPSLCKQLVLSFVGKFLAGSQTEGLHWAEAETLRYARRQLRPFTPTELALHLKLSDNRTRAILRNLLDKKLLDAHSGKQRYRTYRLANG